VGPPPPPPHTFGLKVFVLLPLASDLCAVIHSRGLVGKLFYSLGLWERFGVGGGAVPPLPIGVGPFTPLALWIVLVKYPLLLL
jgi:hypothetical protein